MNTTQLTAAERVALTHTLLTELEAMNKLGPEYFQLKIRLMSQTSREFFAAVEARRNRDTVRPGKVTL
jgi:hypothetical protein